ncbi:MAG: hypothetical protein ABWY14_01390 [Tardiphaga sp.]
MAARAANFQNAGFSAETEQSHDRTVPAMLGLLPIAPHAGCLHHQVSEK